MKITATVTNRGTTHQVHVATAGDTKVLPVPAKASGAGSAVNGGEFLMLALATCYCNDVYREAQRLGIVVEGLEVEASADFEGIGLAATNVRYRARVSSPADDAQVARLLRETDAVAEIHNTLRAGVPVQFEPWEAAAPGRGR